MQRFLIVFGLGIVTILWIGGFTNGFVGHPYGDMPDHVWGNEWFAQSLRDGHWPWKVENNLFPDGGVLWHIDPVGGVFRRLLLFLPPQWIWNLYALGNVWLLGIVGYLWSIDNGVKPKLSFIIAVLLIMNPYSAGLIHSGLSEYWGVWQALLLGWMIERKSWIIAGLCLAMCGVQSFVMGLIGCLFVVTCAWGEFRDVRKWVSLLLPTCLFVLPLGVVCLQTLSHPEALFNPVDAPGWSFKRLPAVDLVGFMSVGDWVHPDTRSLNPGVVQVHSLGWGLIPLLLFGGWHTLRKEIDYSRLTFLLLAMGPRLSIAKWMPFAGSLLLPLALLYVPNSPFSMVHHPYHMVAFVFPLVLPWCMVGIQRIPLTVGIVLIVVSFADRLTGPVPFPMVRSHYAEDVSLEGPRFDFPPDFSTANRRYLLQQLSHREPIAYGVNRWMAPSVFNDAAVQRWVRLLDDPVRRSQNRDQPPFEYPWLSESSAKTKLDELGFQWVVVHRDFLSNNEIQRIEHQLQVELGDPIIQSEKQNVYRLGASN